MALRRPTLVGAGMVAATRPPARQKAVRAVSTARGRRGGLVQILAGGGGNPGHPPRTRKNAILAPSMWVHMISADRLAKGSSGRG